MSENQSSIIENISEVQPLLHAARNCAEAMLQNASYIQDELQSVNMDHALKDQTSEICSQLIGTKHDVVHELFEISDLLEVGTDMEILQSRLSNIIRWISTDLHELHRVVVRLDAATKMDRSFELGYMLVSESATNVLQAFSAFMDATDTFRAVRTSN